MRTLRFAAGKFRILRLRMSADMGAAFRSAVIRQGKFRPAEPAAASLELAPSAPRSRVFPVRSALLQRGVAEFVGTFTLIFVGAGSIIATQGGNLTAIALAHGLAIGVMASAVGHISGGHFNPAVTFGFVVTRRIEIHLAAAYWFAQLIGAVLAAYMLTWLLPESQVNRVNLGAPAVGNGIGAGSAV